MMTTQYANALLDEALHYASRKGWRVLPLHGLRRDGRCTCGSADCGNSTGKHPWGKLVPKGLLEATTEPAQIEAWWAARPGANVGVRTGSGLVVVDIDGPENAATLARIAAEHGATFPPTLSVRTGRGFHFYFAGELEGSPTIAGILLRGEGGYVVAPPSRHYSGREYAWTDASVAPAPLPDWFARWIAEHRDDTPAPQAAPEPTVDLGPRPSWLTGGADPTDRVLAQIGYTEDEVRQALYRIPASESMAVWLNQARSLKDWDAGERGLRIFLEWSMTSTKEKHRTPEAQTKAEAEWHRIKKQKPGRKMRRISSLFRDAEKYGPPTPPTQDAVDVKEIHTTHDTTNGFHHESNTFETAAGVIRKVVWVDVDKHNRPTATCTNARLAIEGLGVACQHDTFADRLYVGGHAIQQWAGELSDNAVLVLRRLIKEAFRFDPGDQHVRDGAVQACLANQHNPVVEYLAGLRWDGRARIDRWVINYLGCPDEPLGQEFGRLMLVAAVRRARHPGTKFDQIIVLEGDEGTGKSTALRILGGEHFSDQRVLGMREKEQQEASAGVWIHEIAELAGMKRAEVEHVKAFASRQEDRARPSYGRFRVDKPRQTVFCATTNAAAYLKSDTGDRRFWPLQTHHIALEALRRDRDSLWAEAAACEARGDSIELDPKFYDMATRAQANRQELDPWIEDIAQFVEKHVDTSIHDVLSLGVRLEIKDCGQVEMNRAARVLRNLGFFRYQKREGDIRSWRYRRLNP